MRLHHPLLATFLACLAFSASAAHPPRQTRPAQQVTPPATSQPCSGIGLYHTRYDVFSQFKGDTSASFQEIAEVHGQGDDPVQCLTVKGRYDQEAPEGLRVITQDAWQGSATVQEPIGVAAAGGEAFQRHLVIVCGPGGVIKYAAAFAAARNSANPQAMAAKRQRFRSFECVQDELGLHPALTQTELEFHEDMSLTMHEAGRAYRLNYGQVNRLFNINAFKDDRGNAWNWYLYQFQVNGQERQAIVHVGVHADGTFSLRTFVQQ